MRALLLVDLAGAGDFEDVPDAVIAAGVPRGSDALTRLCARAKTFVCLGPLSAATFDDDLAIAARAAIEGVALPDCGSGADVQHLAAKLAVAEAESERPDGELGIVAFVGGTPAGVLALGSIVGTSRRLRALVFDGASLDRVLPRASAPFGTARALCVLAAHAAGVPIYEQAGGRDRHEAGEAARRDGFAGLVTASSADLARPHATSAVSATSDG